MAKRRDTAALQVSAERREADRLALKAEMERWYRLKIEQVVHPDDERNRSYRTPGHVQELGTARAGSGSVWDWLAPHGDRAIRGERFVKAAPIHVRPSAVVHLGDAPRDPARFARACLRLQQKDHALSMLFHLVCFDSPWSEADVARAWNDGTPRNGWSRARVQQRKVEACALIRRWCGVPDAAARADASATPDGPEHQNIDK